MERDDTGQAPWGSFRPSAWVRFLIRLCRAVPPLRGVRQLAFLVRRLARRRLHGPVDAHLWGHRLRFLPRGNISEGRLLFMPRLWDPRERRLLAAHLPAGGTFVDVGCNFGGYTWWVLHRLGRECTVLALEPDPDLHARLRFNLDENGADNVRLLPVAAGEASGDAVLHIHPANRGENTLLPAPDDDTGRSVRVAVRPLAELVAEAGMDRVDALKIDIEGFELPVLRAFFADAPRQLWPALLLCERRDVPEHDDLEALLLARGYVPLARTRLNLVLRRGRETRPKGECRTGSTAEREVNR